MAKPMSVDSLSDAGGGGVSLDHAADVVTTEAGALMGAKEKWRLGALFSPAADFRVQLFEWNPYYSTFFPFPTHDRYTTYLPIYVDWP